MVTVLNIPYFEYVGSGAVVVIVFIGWILLRNKSGREGEEQQQESQTERLEVDEKKAEQAQKDEKKVCVKMVETVTEIEDILKKTGMGEIYDQILSEGGSIRVMLWRMRDEKMSLERAIETFKTLHTELNAFIDKLPKGNRTINGLVSRLVYYQKREYTDLIKELMMDRDKKANLRKLWTEVINEESGRDVAQAA